VKTRASILLALAVSSSTLLGTPRIATAQASPIVLIVLENHRYTQIVGSAHAPYLNGTFIPAGTLFTKYHAITHPSLPNYIAMTAGSVLGCKTDICPPNSLGGDNLYSQLDTAGLGWRAWEESMPTNCAYTDDGDYAVRHNPPPYLKQVVSSGSCALNDVPYPATLPPLQPFTFITPNLCNDMHNCSVPVGDTWLSNHVPGLLAAGATVIITFDEGTRLNNHVMTAAVGPDVAAGVEDATTYSHYSLLGGIEARLGLPALRKASTATPLPI
jgi:phosphatidylinositol-3-phosphatase